MARKDVVDQKINKLVDAFAHYVEAYDARPAFTAEQLAAHRQTIDLLHGAGSVRVAIHDERYVSSLRRTLISWGLGVRGSYLVPESEFAGGLQAALPDLEELESLTIDAVDVPSDIADRLLLVIDSLGVVTNQAKLVAGTKTLHHLLPDLVPPMDRVWTARFFGLHNPDWQDSVSQGRTLRWVYGSLVSVARRVNSQQYVTGKGWRTSRTKILDNALIGFCMPKIAEQPSGASDAVNAISFNVPGYPPAKNEALSMLGAGHSHGPRIRLLLEAARQARQQQAFVPIEEGQVALDVVLSAPAGQNPGDATNYLGGIGDVLEDKSRRGVLDHLGDLASVWLYRNDRQIKEVTYREVESDRAGYMVTVRTADSHGVQRPAGPQSA